MRAAVPLVALRPDGTLVRAWGAGLFERPHGIAIGEGDSVVCIDDEDQRVIIFDRHGNLTRTIQGSDQTAVTGYKPGFPYTVRQAAPPFCYPTGAAADRPGGGVWVTDGYGNARVHRFDRDGSLLDSWGGPGSEPGQFVIPHGIFVDEQGHLLVSDRENERVQVMDERGRSKSAGNGVTCPNNVVRAADGDYFVAELGRVVQGMGPTFKVVPQAIRARITRRDAAGRVLGEWTAPDPMGRGLWFAPHGIGVDSQGNVYVGEVVRAFGQGNAPADLPSLHKFERLRSQRS